MPIGKLLNLPAVVRTSWVSKAPAMLAKADRAKPMLPAQTAATLAYKLNRIANQRQLPAADLGTPLPHRAFDHRIGPARAPALIAEMLERHAQRQERLEQLGTLIKR